MVVLIVDDWTKCAPTFLKSYMWLMLGVRDRVRVKVTFTVTVTVGLGLVLVMA